MENKFTVTIPKMKLNELNEKVSVLNKKLKKLGKPEIVTNIAKEFVRDIVFTTHVAGTSFREDSNVIRPVRFVEVEIDAPVFSFTHDGNAYEYLGSIRIDKGIRTYHIVNEEYAQEFLKECDYCDHCHTNRKRNGYFLFKKADDEKILRIGSTCAKDYFGYDISRETKVYFETVDVVREEYDVDNDCISDCEIPFSVLYANVKEATNDFSNYGSAYSENPTATLVKANIYIKQKHWDEGNHPEEKRIVREYWEKQEGYTDFLMNIREAVSYDYASKHNLGIMAYAIFKAMNEYKKELAIKEFENNAVTYKQGDKAEFDAVVIANKEYESMFGTSHLIEFVSGKNNYLTFTTSASAISLKSGDKVSVKGTIGENKMFNEKIYTKMKRCKFSVK